jgi:5-methyltetrahydropteroyltriglutamate--homocysteine methyltransferase
MMASPAIRPLPLLPTTLVGSYPQPEWLVDRDLLLASAPARVPMRELWRVASPQLQQAQDDATVLALREQERAGIDIVTDGEMRRESYFNWFATRLDGLDLERPGLVTSRTGRSVLVPRVTGRVRRPHAVGVRDVEFLRAHTRRRIKVTVPGPFTMSQLAVNEHYPSTAAMAFDYAEAVRAEIVDLFGAGADVVQMDEPYLQARPEAARDYGVEAVQRALDGVRGTTALHICFGYGTMVSGKPARYAFLRELASTTVAQLSVETAQPSLDCSVLRDLVGKTIVLGTLDLSTSRIETPRAVADRIRQALRHVAPERLVVAPDCGLKYLTRAVAYAKLRAMVRGAAIVREELETPAPPGIESPAQCGSAPLRASKADFSWG